MKILIVITSWILLKVTECMRKHLAQSLTPKKCSIYNVFLFCFVFSLASSFSLQGKFFLCWTNILVFGLFLYINFNCMPIKNDYFGQNILKMHSWIGPILCPRQCKNHLLFYFIIELKMCDKLLTQLASVECQLFR